jgi:hypothetical protein
LLLVLLFFTMGRLGKAIAGAIKKVTGSGAKGSHGSSSSRYTEREKSPMQEDEETEPTEEQEEQVQEQGQSMVEGEEPHLDLERGQEMKAYHFIKNHEFEPTPMYDPALLQTIGMDDEFISI